MPLNIIQERRLQVTVWSHDTLQENELLGGFDMDLSKYDLRQELVDWYRLGAVSRNWPDPRDELFWTSWDTLPTDNQA